MQAVCLLSELKQTQRSVVKCLSEAEQAKKEYDELKHKTQLIMMQLEQVTCKLPHMCINMNVIFVINNQ
jgi:hypothetical protein